jgi:hypothetical protein
VVPVVADAEALAKVAEDDEMMADVLKVRAMYIDLVVAAINQEGCEYSLPLMLTEGMHVLQPMTAATSIDMSR